MRSAVHVRSLGSAKIISLDIESVRARLKAAANRLHEQDANVESVWLFGSLARGDFLPGSDADVLIVLKKSDRPFHDRSDQFMDWFADIGVPVDVLPVTTSELKERAGDPFWAKVIAERGGLA